MKAVQNNEGALSPEDINAIGLAMENIKKSAEVMSFTEVTRLAEAVGEVVLYVRQHRPVNMSSFPLEELVRQTVVFMRQVMNKLDWNALPDASSESLCGFAHNLLHGMQVANGDSAALQECEAEHHEHRFYIEPLKQEVKQVNIFAVTVFFLHADGVEDIQAYSFLQYLQDKVQEMHHLPEKILEDENAIDTIRNIGLRIWLTTDSDEAEMRDFLDHVSSVGRFELTKLSDISQCEYWPDAEMAAITAAETGEGFFAAREPQNGYVNGVMPRQSQDGQPSTDLTVQFLRIRETVNDLVLADALAAQNNFSQAALQVRKLITQLDRRIRTLLPMVLSNEAEVPDSLWIEGTSVGVGNLRFTFPNAFIHQPFRPAKDEIFSDPDGQTLFMHDGECYPLLSLSKFYQIENAATEPEDGIVMVLEGGAQPFGVLADRLLEVQELEVKPVPEFIGQMMRSDCIIGCTFLQDGSISMVIDVAELSEMLC